MAVGAQAACRIVDDTTPPGAVPFAQLRVGDAVAQRVAFTPQLRASFAGVAQDGARLHADGAFARARGYERPILPGLCVTSRFSRLLGMYLPGENAVIESLQFKFRKPVYEDATVDYLARIVRVLPPLRVVRLELTASVDGVTCVAGEAQCLVREVAA